MVAFVVVTASVADTGGKLSGLRDPHELKKVAK
jgi:hypothetical protein